MDCSSPTDLAQLRTRGERPVGPIVVTEDSRIAAWASDPDRGFFTIQQSPEAQLGPAAGVFAGLDVLVVTLIEFGAWQAIAMELADAGVRFLLLADRTGRRRAQQIVGPM